MPCGTDPVARRPRARRTRSPARRTAAVVSFRILRSVVAVGRRRGVMAFLVEDEAAHLADHRAEAGLAPRPAVEGGEEIHLALRHRGALPDARRVLVRLGVGGIDVDRAEDL